MREDASLTYTKKKTTSKPSKSFNILNNEENDNVLDLSDSITIEKIPIDSSSAGGSGNTSSNSTEYPLGSAIGVISDIGVRVTCKKYGIDTEFRVVFPEQELMHFVDALCNITTIRNLSEFKRVMHWDDKPDWIPVSSTISSRNPLVGTFIDPTNVEAQFNMSRMTHGSDDSADSLDAELMGYSTSYDANALSNMVSGPISMLMSTLSFNGAENRVGSKSHKVAMERSHGSELNAYGAQQSMGGGKQYIIQQSVMRRAITKAMDRYDRDARISQTIARRGAFRWLPVAFTNDLVHGSWWFVFGALLTTVISVIILLNSYYPHQLLGVDRDMGLPLHLYRVTWIMLSLSGALYFIGSLAFVRAVNEPPMRPLFPNWSHAATDELLGSWLFFYGTVPSIPYSILYLYWFGNYWYLGMLIVAVISTMACYLFVLSCYPSDKVSYYAGGCLVSAPF